MIMIVMIMIVMMMMIEMMIIVMMHRRFELKPKKLDTKSTDEMAGVISSIKGWRSNLYLDSNLFLSRLASRTARSGRSPSY